MVFSQFCGYDGQGDLFVNGLASFSGTAALVELPKGRQKFVSIKLDAPVPKSGVQRGTFVAVCAPLGAADLGRRRGYLAAGPCPADTELLLKVVAAVAGDVVAVSANGVGVNGCPLPRSRPLSFDGAGRRLSPWPQGRYRLGLGQLWLYADNARSWDSRYWGPVPLVHVTARAVPLLVSRLIKRDWSMLTDRRFFANRQ